MFGRCFKSRGESPKPGLGGLPEVTSPACGKKVGAQACAVEQHAWSCRASRGDPYRVLGNQQVDGVVSGKNQGGSSRGVRLQCVVSV